MLKITIPAIELYDERAEEFISTKAQTLQLEHSLVSLSKWESKFCKPFLTSENKTKEETIEYIRCMTLTQNVDPAVYKAISSDNVQDVREYIDSEMTATTISLKETKTINREVITAEIIYYWMIALTIPFECQKWHLNRLLTLINVCNIKNTPGKKMSKAEIIERNRAINAARLEKMNTTG